MSDFLPALTNWPETKETLHLYSKVIGVVPRAHAVAHPSWWHISLNVAPDGLVTNSIPLDCGAFQLKMNLHTHTIDVVATGYDMVSFPMTAGFSANEMAEKVFSTLANMGVHAEYLSEKYDDDSPRSYDPESARRYLTALVNVEHVFAEHRANLPGEPGPLQVWPHGFDLAFEFFGTKSLEYEEHGELQTFRSQINLGFSPGEPTHPYPYFYSNPWPFEADVLLAKPLPHGAEWVNESWQGSILNYELLAAQENAKQMLAEYARAVYDASAPTLMAE